MAGTHTIGGINYADAFHATMTIVGSALVLFGVGLIVSNYIEVAAYERSIKTVN